MAREGAQALLQHGDHKHFSGSPQQQAGALLSPQQRNRLPARLKDVVSTPVVFQPRWPGASPAVKALPEPCKPPARPLREMAPQPGGSEPAAGRGRGWAALCSAAAKSPAPSSPPCGARRAAGCQLTGKERGDREGAAIMAKLLSSSGPASTWGGYTAGEGAPAGLRRHFRGSLLWILLGFARDTTERWAGGGEPRGRQLSTRSRSPGSSPLPGVSESDHLPPAWPHPALALFWHEPRCHGQGNAATSQFHRGSMHPKSGGRGF